MKKIVSFALLVMLVFGLVACSGDISKEEYDKVVAERDALREQMDELQSLNVDLGLFESAGQAFAEDATCVALSEHLVQITIPYSVEAEENLEYFNQNMGDLVEAVTKALQTSEFISCIVMFVDDGECYMGATLKEDGNPTTFAIED